MQENINIPDSNITTNLTFRQLVIMNMQQLTNFPYIEKDFDALTDYELLCLVVKFLNDVINNQNEQNASITRLYESFLALQDYVNNTKDTLEDAFNNLDDYVRNYFANLDVQDEIDNKLDEMVEDGTFERLLTEYLQLKDTFLRASVIGLIPNDNTEATNNYTKLKTYIDKGFNIIIDDDYYIEHNSDENVIEIDRDVIIKGFSTDTCIIENVTNQENNLFNFSSGSITLEKLQIKNNVSYETNVIINIDDEELGQNINIKDCLFSGNVFAIHITCATSVITSNTLRYDSINILNNEFKNSEVPCIRISNAPGGFVTLSNNTIKNVTPYFLRLTPDSSFGDTSTVAKNIDGIIANNNTMINDNNTFSTDGTYGAFLVLKCNKVEVYNNYVEGIKSNDSSTGVYSVYALGYDVNIENNIFKNIVNFSSNDYNYLMKSKSYEGIKKFYNNIYILEKSWLSTINNNFDVPYTDEDLKTNTTCTLFHIQDLTATKWLIKNNNIDVPVLMFPSTTNDTKSIEISNNTINCDNLLEGLRVSVNCNEIIFNNNNFNVKESTSNYFMALILQTANENREIFFNNNNFNLNNNRVQLIHTNDNMKVFKTLIATGNNVINKNTSTNNSYFIINNVSLSDNAIVECNVEDNTLNPLIQTSIFNNNVNYKISAITHGLNGTSMAQKNSIYLPKNEVELTDKYYVIKFNYFDVTNNVLKTEEYPFRLYRNDNKNYISFKVSDTIQSFELSQNNTENINQLMTDVTGNQHLQLRMTTGGRRYIRFIGDFLNDSLIHKVNIEISNI